IPRGCYRTPTRRGPAAGPPQRSRGGKPGLSASSKTSSFTGPFGLTPDVSRRVHAPSCMPPLAQIQDNRGLEMKTFTNARAFRAALIAATIGGASTAALAEITDYKFELVDQTVQAGPDKIITVRLINRKTGKPVPDAVIFATRLDMAPDGMEAMATKIAPVPA